MSSVPPPVPKKKVFRPRSGKQGLATLIGYARYFACVETYKHEGMNYGDIWIRLPHEKK